MKKEDLHILMLEDNALDAELNIEQLELLEEYNCIIEIIQDKESYIRQIESSDPPQLILCDYNLPQYNGMEALKDLNKRGKLIPFIFVTGTMQEEIAADAIKAGAWDYVVKDRLFRLPLAIKGVLELKKKHEIARSSEDKIKQLIKSIDQTSVQIIITDKNRYIEYANRKVSEVTGLSFDELKGMDATLFNNYENNHEINSIIESCLKNGEIFTGELPARGPNKELRWELVSITPIKNTIGEITNYVAVKEDITARKEMEEDLIQARDKAEESNRLKTAFLHNVSHEIRTPLNVISGYSNMLNDMEFTEEEKKDFISIINKSSKQLVSILIDIFAISTLETKQEKINEEYFCVNNIIDELYQIFKQQSKEKNITLSIKKTLSDDQSYINSDKTKITQILSNLINNGLKFTLEGTLEFGYNATDNLIEFFVKDTGIGIHPDFHEVIFDRFRQADTSTNRRFGGSGLGLAIAKGYTELLGGKIRVESEPGNGSLFIFTIPYNIFDEST